MAEDPQPAAPAAAPTAAEGKTLRWQIGSSALQVLEHVYTMEPFPGARAAGRASPTAQRSPRLVSPSISRRGLPRAARERAACARRPSEPIRPSRAGLETRRDLARQLNVSARQVQVWFQNKRQRERKISKQMGLFSTPGLPDTPAATAAKAAASAGKAGEGGAAAAAAAAVEAAGRAMRPRPGLCCR